MNLLINLCLLLFALVAVLMVFIILMQRPKNEGLGAAFGGGVTDNIFGAQTTNVLANITRWLGGIFFVVSLLLSFLYSQQISGTSASQRHLGSLPVPKPATTPAPAPAIPPVAPAP